MFRHETFRCVEAPHQNYRKIQNGSWNRRTLHVLSTLRQFSIEELVYSDVHYPLFKLICTN